MLVSALIDEAFIDLRVIPPGGSVASSAATQADAFLRLNQLMSSLSIEGLMAYNRVLQTFALQAGVVAYTLGAGGSFATNGGLRAVKVESWRANYSTLLSLGGRVLSIEEFNSAAQQVAGEQSAIPKIVGADTAFPQANVRVFPPPSSTPGQIELAYWTPLPQFAAVGSAVSLPDGWERMLHLNLAVDLYPQYGRQGGIDPVLAADAQNAKASIVQQNSMGSQPAQTQQ